MYLGKLNGLVRSRRGLLAGAVLATMLLVMGSPARLEAEPQKATENKPTSDKPAAKTVSLTIDFSDGSQLVFPALPWQEKQTVLSTLEQAAKHPRGVKLEKRGSGETAMVTAIGGAENEGSGRNWLFRVNGDLGDRSSAIFEVSPGDAVLWKFGTYE